MVEKFKVWSRMIISILKNAKTSPILENWYLVSDISIMVDIEI